MLEKVFEAQGPWSCRLSFRLVLKREQEIFGVRQREYGREVLKLELNWTAPKSFSVSVEILQRCVDSGGESGIFERSLIKTSFATTLLMLQ